jgi:two-component system response regulator (stage 0 sporulation protein A)
MLTDTIEIVVVDNNQDLCEIMAGIIGDQPDMQVVGTAYNGLDALELVQRKLPDVLILDIVMPYLNGLGVMWRLRESALPRLPKIIVVTAFEQEGLIKDCVELGAAYYMLKPFDYDDMLRAIRRLCRGNIVSRDSASEVTCASPIDEPVGKDLDSRIMTLLHSIGMPIHFKGYRYTKDAILRVVRDFSLLTAVTRRLYPIIADEFGTTGHGVEAAIRHAIKKTWKNGNSAALRTIFATNGNKALPKVPGNAAFLAKMAEFLRAEDLTLI